MKQKLCTLNGSLRFLCEWSVVSLLWAASRRVAAEAWAAGQWVKVLHCRLGSFVLHSVKRLLRLLRQKGSPKFYSLVTKLDYVKSLQKPKPLCWGGLINCWKAEVSKTRFWPQATGSGAFLQLERKNNRGILHNLFCQTEKNSAKRFFQLTEKGKN